MVSISEFRRIIRDNGIIRDQTNFPLFPVSLFLNKIFFLKVLVNSPESSPRSWFYTMPNNSATQSESLKLGWANWRDKIEKMVWPSG